MQIKLDQDNYFWCELEFGGRITQLVLAGHLIIKAGEDKSDLGSGIFLMFPWISKVPQSPYDLALLNQYHGFVMNTKREVIEKRQENGQIRLSMRQAVQRQNQHNFIETYVLSKNSLKIMFRVLINEKDKNPFCFGYHPYLQIDQQKIEELQIKSDITTLLKFDQNTLPIYPFAEEQIQLKTGQKYNNLFRGGSYFELISKKKSHLRIQSDLPYWQIYTPNNSNKIAVEPASFCGNLYNIYDKDPSINLVKQGSIQLRVWDE